MPKAGQKARKGRRPTEKKVQPEVEDLKSQLREREAEVSDLEDRLKYVQADLQNLQKRSEKERRESYNLAVEGTLKRLLPVVDEFDLALRALNSRKDEMVEGVRMIHRNLLSVLQSSGLMEIDAMGKVFDPYVHEAVAYVEDEEEGRVMEVLLKGYRTEERILRPSQVVVSKKRGEADG